MLKLIRLLFLTITVFLLSGCLTDIWTGASLIYGRHSLYKSMSNYSLSMQVNNALYKDHLLKCHECYLETAVFNGDILLVGNLPNEQLKQEAGKRVAKIRGKHRVFNQISFNPLTNSSIEDSLITTKIRGQIIADS